MIKMSDEGLVLKGALHELLADTASIINGMYRAISEQLGEEKAKAKMQECFDIALWDDEKLNNETIKLLEKLITTLSAENNGNNIDMN